MGPHLIAAHGGDAPHVRQAMLQHPVGAARQVDAGGIGGEPHGHARAREERLGPVHRMQRDLVLQDPAVRRVPAADQEARSRARPD